MRVTTLTAYVVAAAMLGVALADAPLARQCDQKQTHFWKNVTLKKKEADEFSFRRTTVVTVPGPLYISAWMNSINVKKDVDEDTGNVVRGAAVITARLTAMTGLGPLRGTPPSLHVGTFRRRTDFTPYDNETGNGNLTVGKFGMAFAIAFTEIVEFVDKNGDRKFDEGDTVLQTVNLDQLHWDKLCWESPNQDTPGIISFNISATDPRLTFSEKVEFSNVVGKLHNNKILTPKAGKISVEISDFQYTPGVTESQLAIHVYVLAAAAGAKSIFKKVLGGSATAATAAMTMSDAAYFTWDTSVNVTAGKLSALHHNDFADGDPADLTGETASILFSAYTGGNVTVKHAWFSVDANQPSHVYWDPELGAGDIPEESETLPTWAIVLIAGGTAIVAVTLIGVGIATWRRRRGNYVDL